MSSPRSPLSVAPCVSLSRRRALVRLGTGSLGAALAVRRHPSLARDETSESNEELVRRMYAAYNAADWTALDAVFAADVVDHDATPGQVPGLAGITQQLMAFKAAFAGEVVIDELVSEGVWVTDRIHLDGTHVGAFFGIPATGRPVQIEGIEMWQIRDGTIAAGWHVENLLQVLIQIGAIAAPGGAPLASPAASPTA